VRRRRGREHKTESFPNNVYICRLGRSYLSAQRPYVAKPMNIGGCSRSNGTTPIFIGSRTQPTNII
jgi:hypothetical protein